MLAVSKVSSKTIHKFQRNLSHLIASTSFSHLIRLALISRNWSITQTQSFRQNRVLRNSRKALTLELPLMLIHCIIRHHGWCSSPRTLPIKHGRRPWNIDKSVINWFTHSSVSFFFINRQPAFVLGFPLCWSTHTHSLR